MSAVQNYLNDLVQAERLYLANWVIPYSDAYIRAHTSFQKTLADQKAYDTMMADLALMALTLGLGAGMASLFAKAGVKSAGELIANKTVEKVVEKNLTRTFDLIGDISGSVAGSYLVAQGWKLVSGKINKATESKVKSLFSPTALARDTIAHPQTAQNNLRRYLALTIAAAHDIAADIGENKSMPEAEKEKIVAEFKKARLITEMPYKSCLPPKAAEMMELNMWMALILANDVSTVSTGVGAAYYGNVKKKTTPIDPPPSDPSYPKPYNRNKTHGSGFSTSVTINTRTVSVDFGRKIWNRINTLHKSLFGSEFNHVGGTFSGKTTVAGYDKVVAAEEMSRRLQLKLYPEMRSLAPGR